MPRRLALIGAGGLAHAFLLALKALYGESLSILIVDGDTVELSNLNRQVLFGTTDLGQPKATTLAKQLQQTAPRLCASAVSAHLTAENCEELLRDCSLIVDATDSVETKFLLNDYAIRRGIPFCYAGVSGYEALVLLSIPDRGACLRCLFGDFSADDTAAQNATCQAQGVFGAFVGLCGALQAEEVARLLCASPAEDITSRLTRIRQFPLSVRRYSAPASEECRLGCGQVQQLDLRAEQCPLTFLYTKIALEKLPPRGTLSVSFGSATSADNVMRSVTAEGYEVRCAAQNDHWRLRIWREEAQ